jgi:hypothetical protein
MLEKIRPWVVVALILCAAAAGFVAIIVPERQEFIALAVALMALAYLNDYAEHH